MRYRKSQNRTNASRLRVIITKFLHTLHTYYSASKFLKGTVFHNFFYQQLINVDANIQFLYIHCSLILDHFYALEN